MNTILSSTKSAFNRGSHFMCLAIPGKIVELDPESTTSWEQWK